MPMETPITPEKFITRKLTKDDWKIYKELRLEALQNDPQAFGRSYKEEAVLPDSSWIGQLEDSRRASYGAENNHKLASFGSINFNGCHLKSFYFWTGNSAAIHACMPPAI